MQTKAMAPSLATRRIRQRQRQEGDELSSRHLAGGKGELAMPDRAQSRDVAVDRDTMGLVGDDQIDRLSPCQPRNILPRASIAAEQPVRAELPAVYRAGDRLIRRRWG